MARVLLDTDVLVDHLRGDRRFEPREDAVHLCAVTRAELFSTAGADDARLERLLDAMTDVPITPTVARRAGTIRRTTGLDIASAIVAATAVENNLTLVTRNLWGYRGIDGLDAMAPDAR